MARVEYQLLNDNKYKPIKLDPSEIHAYILRLPKEISFKGNEKKFVYFDLKLFLPLIHHYALLTSFHKSFYLMVENTIHSAEMGDDELKLFCINKSDYPIYLDKGFRLGLAIFPNPSEKLHMFEAKN